MSMPEKKPDRSHEAQELLIQRERQRCASIVSAHVDGQPADVDANCYCFKIREYKRHRNCVVRFLPPVS